jgi:uracil phosphoribosyltransferase
MQSQKHLYGPQVTLLKNTYANSLLAKLCQPETKQPLVQEYVQELFRQIAISAINAELPVKPVKVATRMTSASQKKLLETSVLDVKQRAVTVSLARAGIPASQVVYDLLNHALDPELVRQDHIWATRVTDGKDQVIGADLGAAKIGGDVAQSVVFLPDPMGATGGTIISTLDFYKTKYKGKSAKFVALHLIVTPEYLKRVLGKHPDIKIYALRLDRGLSSKKALASEPGTYWDQEKGLNEKQYIIPGAGGLGEILNNSFV